MNFRLAYQQMSILRYELTRLVNRRSYRWFTMWFGGSCNVIVSYRIDRALYLLIGRAYGVLRPVFYPFFLLLRIFGSRHEISYMADIGKGLNVLHPTLGVVISAKAICGDHLTLTGGNCIGGRKPIKPGDVRLGDGVNLGANAVVLGPCSIGNNVRIGAGAVVVKNFPDGSIVGGVPAQALRVSDAMTEAL